MASNFSVQKSSQFQSHAFDLTAKSMERKIVISC
jgi:hypothetical protein